MASPVFHGLAGAGLSFAMAGDASLPFFASLRKTAKILAAGAVLACLPDVDYLPGLMRGYLNTAHQQATHGVAWVFLASAGIWMLGRAWRPALFGWKAGAFLLILIGSHLAIDLLTEDRLAPYGIPVWTPFSGTPLRGPIALFPAWDKTTLADLGSGRNWHALRMEAGWGLLLAGGCLFAKRGWTWRKAAL